MSAWLNKSIAVPPVPMMVPALVMVLRAADAAGQNADVAQMVPRRALLISAVAAKMPTLSVVPSPPRDRCPSSPP